MNINILLTEVKGVYNMECMVNNIKINYEIYGEGIPVLMIHGWSVDCRLMKGCMEPVFQNTNKEWKRIYFDLPGMGKSKSAPWITGADQMLDLVLGFIDAVIPDENFVLAGESYGGLLARGVINKRFSQVDGLLLICPAAGRDTSAEKDAQFQVLEEDILFLNSLTEEEKNFFQAEGINVVRNKQVWDRYKEEVLPGLKIADATFLQNCTGKLSFDVDALENPFIRPTLMFAGRQDSIVGYRGLWRIIERYPRASFVLLDKAGHALQIEQGALFTETVKEGLNRVVADRVHNN